MTSFNPPATDDDASTPVVPGPGLRWSGDGALAPKPAPALVFELPAPRRDRGLAEGVVLASVWRRLAAWFIDRGLKTLVFLIVIKLSGQEIPDSVLNTPGLVFASALLNAGYEFVFGIHGVTPGGHLLHLRITAINGAEPGARRSLARASAASLNEVFLFAGSFLALIDRRRQTIHDKIAGTIVINVPVVPAVPTDPERRV